MGSTASRTRVIEIVTNAGCNCTKRSGQMEVLWGALRGEFGKKGRANPKKPPTVWPTWTGERPSPTRESARRGDREGLESGPQKRFYKCSVQPPLGNGVHTRRKHLARLLGKLGIDQGKKIVNREAKGAPTEGPKTT